MQNYRNYTRIVASQLSERCVELVLQAEKNPYLAPRTNMWNLRNYWFDGPIVRFYRPDAIIPYGFRSSNRIEYRSKRKLLRKSGSFRCQFLSAVVVTGCSSAYRSSAGYGGDDLLCHARQNWNRPTSTARRATSLGQNTQQHALQFRRYSTRMLLTMNCSMLSKATPI